MPQKGVLLEDDDDTISHQCILSAAQVEEIYLRTYKGEHDGESKVGFCLLSIELLFAHIMYLSY